MQFRRTKGQESYRLEEQLGICRWGGCSRRKSAYKKIQQHYDEGLNSLDSPEFRTFSPLCDSISLSMLFAYECLNRPKNLREVSD